MSNIKSQINNNCSNGLSNLCCQPPSAPQQNNNIKPLMEQNIPKKTIKIIDAPNGKGFANSLDNSSGSASSSDASSADLPKMKIIEDENSEHGIKLTDIALPHISVKTVECKKTEKPTTTIIIYKSKNPNRAPTAKIIQTKVRDDCFLLVSTFTYCSMWFHTKNCFLNCVYLSHVPFKNPSIIDYTENHRELILMGKQKFLFKFFHFSKCHTVN